MLPLFFIGGLQLRKQAEQAPPEGDRVLPLPQPVPASTLTFPYLLCLAKYLSCLVI